MATRTTLSVSLLSGALQDFEVAPETPISEIRKKLESGLPVFHEVQLYAGDVRLLDSVLAREVNGEVKAVAIGSITQAFEALEEWEDEYDSDEYINNRVPCALKLIAQFEDDLDEHHFKRLLGTFGGQLALFRCVFKDHLGDNLCPYLELVVRLLGRFGTMDEARSLRDVFWDGFEWSRECLDMTPWQLAELALTKEEDDISAMVDKFRGDVDKFSGDVETSRPLRHRFEWLFDQARHQILFRSRSQNVEEPIVHINTVPPDNGNQVHQGSQELEVAIRESAAEAIAQEGADVQEALLRSNIESAQRQVLVVLRLTKRNSHVVDALLKDKSLLAVQALVEEAGCEILPDWAAGGVVLVPLTQEQAEEAGVRLRAHHIVVTQQHQALVEKALAAIPKRRRPAVQLADLEHLSGDSVKASTMEPRPDTLKAETQPYLTTFQDWDGLWQVERTFVHCPLPQAESDGSRTVQSEPWGGAMESRPLKLRRLLPSAFRLMPSCFVKGNE